METHEGFLLPPMTNYPDDIRPYAYEMDLSLLALYREALLEFYAVTPAGALRDFLRLIRCKYSQNNSPEIVYEWCLFETALWQLKQHGFLPSAWRPHPAIATTVRNVSWLKLRFQIFKRDNYRCRLCGVSAKDGEHVRLEVDHITPRSNGGTDDEMNLWTLCFFCNRGKGTKEL